MAHDVFISYSTHDKDVATAVCTALEQRHFTVWMAPRDILPGMMWGEAIIDAINDTRSMVIIYSSHSNRSGQVMREVERAAGKNVPIIPFRIEDVPASKSLEFFLSSPHWLDAMEPPIEKHLNTLVRTVRSLLTAASSDEQPVTTTRGGPTVRLENPKPVMQESKGGKAAWIALSMVVVLAGLGATAWYTGLLDPWLRPAAPVKVLAVTLPHAKAPVTAAPAANTHATISPPPRTVTRPAATPSLLPAAPAKTAIASATSRPKVVAATSHPKVAAAALPPPPPKISKAELDAQEFARGMDAYKANDFTAAMHTWKPLAESGYARAQDALGRCYQNGQGTAADPQRAATLFRAAAEQGDENGEADLGMAYKLGIGVAQSDTDAFHWFEASAKSGSPAGEYLLANLYEKGRGVTRSMSEARSWYEKSAAKGYRLAQDRLRELGP